MRLAIDGIGSKRGDRVWVGPRHDGLFRRRYRGEPDWLKVVNPTNRAEGR